MTEGELTEMLLQDVNDELRCVLSLLVVPLAPCGDAIQDLDDVLVTIVLGQVYRQVALRVPDVRVRAVLQQHPHGVHEAFVRSVVQQGAAAGRVDHVRVGAPLEEEEEQARVPHLNNLNSGQYSRRLVKVIISFYF